MAEQQVKLNIGLKEINSILCPQCQMKLRELVKTKITDSMVTNILGDKGEQR